MCFQRACLLTGINYDANTGETNYTRVGCKWIAPALIFLLLLLRHQQRFFTLSQSYALSHYIIKGEIIGTIFQHELIYFIEVLWEGQVGCGGGGHILANMA